MSLFGGNSGETSGYNCQKINDLGTVINNCAQKAASTIVDRLHDEIIIPISTAWYAPEAIDFFSGFKSTVLGWSKSKDTSLKVSVLGTFFSIFGD